MIMESVLDDLNGDSQEDRETEAKKAIIREAKGNKANDTLEVTLSPPPSLRLIHSLSACLICTP